MPIACDVMQYAKIEKVLSVSSFSYTAPTAIGTVLGKRLNKLGLSFFYLTFLNVFLKFFLERFYIYGIWWTPVQFPLTLNG